MSENKLIEQVAKHLFMKKVRLHSPYAGDDLWDHEDEQTKQGWIDEARALLQLPAFQEVRELAVTIDANIKSVHKQLEHFSNPYRWNESAIEDINHILSLLTVDEPPATDSLREGMHHILNDELRYAKDYTSAAIMLRIGNATDRILALIKEQSHED